MIELKTDSTFIIHVNCIFNNFLNRTDNNEDKTT